MSSKALSPRRPEERPLPLLEVGNGVTRSPWAQLDAGSLLGATVVLSPHLKS